MIVVLILILSLNSNKEEEHIVGDINSIRFHAKAEVKKTNENEKTIEVKLLEEREFFDNDNVNLDCSGIDNFSQIKHGQQIVFYFFYPRLREKPLYIDSIELIDT